MSWPPALYLLHIFKYYYIHFLQDWLKTSNFVNGFVWKSCIIPSPRTINRFIVNGFST